MSQGYLPFLRANAPYLAAGALLSFLSSFGQTYFLSIFAGEIRADFSLSHGDWGQLYMVGTLASAVLMIWAGGLADRFRVRSLGIIVVSALAAACLAMALNRSWLGLLLLIFTLRFLGQGMCPHISAVAMTRWFIVNRGRALAIAALGFMLGEALLPLLLVWLKTHVPWRSLWIAAALFCLAMVPVLHRLLRLERTPQSVAEETASPGIGGRHWTRAEALTDPVFWLIAPAIVFFSAFGTVFWFQQVLFAEVKGISHLALVSVFPIGTAVLALASIGYGWAIDRFGAIRLLPIYILPYIAAFALHGTSGSLPAIALAVVLMGLAGGGHGTIITACWAELYGTRHIGAIKSAATALMVFGSAVGPGLSGTLIDAGIGLEAQMFGYAASFALAAVLLVIASRRALAPAP